MKKWSFRIVVLIVSLGLIWTLYIQWKIHSSEVMNLGEEPADVCIILGAALWNDRPSPALRERLNTGIALYDEGHCLHVIATGGLGNNGSSIPEAEGMMTYMVERGIHQNQIRAESKARNTYENLLYSQEIMEDEGWTSAVIVTHSYHGARALDMAKFLNYERPIIQTMDSEVMFMPYHKARETLAYTKWTLEKWFKIIRL